MSLSPEAALAALEENTSAGFDLDDLIDATLPETHDMTDLTAMLAAAEAQLASDISKTAQVESEAQGLQAKLEAEGCKQNSRSRQSDVDRTDRENSLILENEELRNQLKEAATRIKSLTDAEAHTGGNPQWGDAQAALSLQLQEAPPSEDSALHRKQLEASLRKKEQSLVSEQKRHAIEGEKAQLEMDSFMAQLQRLEQENSQLQRMLSEQAASMSIDTSQALVAWLDSNYARLPSQLEADTGGMAHVWSINLRGREGTQGVLLLAERDHQQYADQGLGNTTLHALLAKSEAECEQLHETKRNLMARVRESDQRVLDMRRPKHEIGDMVGKLLQQEQKIVQLRTQTDDLQAAAATSKMVKQQLAEQNAALQRKNWELQELLGVNNTSDKSKRMCGTR